MNTCTPRAAWSSVRLDVSLGLLLELPAAVEVKVFSGSLTATTEVMVLPETGRSGVL